MSEIDEYFRSLSLTTPLGNKAAREIYLQAYKYFFAILVWNYALSARKRKTIGASDPILYFQEFVSDLVQSQILFLIGIYKSGRGSLRSAVENFFRFICLAQGEPIAQIKNTYDLIKAAKRITKATNPEILPFVEQIATAYGELCKHVHSATIAHMAFIDAIEDTLVYRANSFENCCEQTKISCMNAGKIVFWLRSVALKNAGHKSYDFVLDTLPKKLKRLNSSRHG